MTFRRGGNDCPEYGCRVRQCALDVGCAGVGEADVDEGEPESVAQPPRVDAKWKVNELSLGGFTAPTHPFTA